MATNPGTLLRKKIKPGDVVQLQSGGPLMTASHETQDGTLLCQWFAPVFNPEEDHFGFGPLQAGTFRRETLERAPLDELPDTTPETFAGAD